MRNSIKFSNLGFSIELGIGEYKPTNCKFIDPEMKNHKLSFLIEWWTKLKMIIKLRLQKQFIFLSELFIKSATLLIKRIGCQWDVYKSKTQLITTIISW